jgi:hypothetical protein
MYFISESRHTQPDSSSPFRKHIILLASTNKMTRENWKRRKNMHEAWEFETSGMLGNVVPGAVTPHHVYLVQLFYPWCQWFVDILASSRPITVGLKRGYSYRD